MVEIQIIRNDDIDAFGAYAEDQNIILFNVQANLICALEEKIDFKELVLENLMHEFGHCMEEKLELEFDEDRIRRIVDTYIEKHHKHGKKESL